MDEIKEGKGISILKKIFLLFAIATIVFFIVGQSVLSEEKRDSENSYTVFSDGWVWIKQDGSRESINIPGKYDVERGNVMTIENSIPDNVQDNLYLFIRSSKHEMKVYIDNELRQEYSTKDTRWFGKVSAVAWVFVKLYEEDAGKKITIELATDSSYSGVLHDIHYGERWDIYRAFFKENGLELAIGLIMLLIGIISIVISIALKITYKKKIEMEYLAWEVLLISVWILSNSVFRQVMFPSISIVSDMAFFMVMLIAIPVMLYLNDIQKGRYEKSYFIMVLINLTDAFICTLLHIFNIVDFSDSIKCMGAVAGISIGLMAFTLIRDLFTGKIKEYILVALGICAVCVASIVQLVIYFKWTNQFSGSIMAAGLVVVLLISFFNTINDVLAVEKEKQRAIVSNDAKGKFLANMSHEIRTPINSVLGMNTMILRECEDENIREYAVNIQNAGQTLLSLINDILDFSKIESGKMEIVPVEYDFSSMVHDVVTMIMMRAEEKGLTMKLSVDSSIPFRLYGDEVRIRQILLNLLSNAVKYTKEGSIGLSIKCEKEDDEVILKFSVEDTGIGIKSEDIDKLFARFERIEEERNRNIEGTGLGMSITIQLLKLMDSDLIVESEYGKGSAFSFELRQKVMRNEPVGQLERNIKEFPVKPDNKYKASFTAPDADVLVVDDNMMNRKVFIALLKQSKIHIDEAESGLQCLEMVKEKHYDIIFLDHMMPDMDGIETLNHMKDMSEDASFKCKSTPVIALTANAITGAKEMYLEAGFDEFLSKPVQSDKLEMMIASWLPKDKLVYEEEEQLIEKIEDNEEEDLADKFKAKEEIPITNEQPWSKLSQIEGISWDKAFEHLPDMEILMETVDNFYMMINGEADNLEKFYNLLDKEQSAVDNYRIKVHAMKSAAALIGAMDLSEMAKELEYAAKDKKIYVIKERHNEFLTTWRGFKDKLSLIVKEAEKEEISDVSEIFDMLEQLITAVDDMDVEVSDELMKKLMQYDYPEEVSEHISELSSAVVDLDYDTVAEIVEKIKKKYL